MFAAAVHTRIRFLMQQDTEMMPLRHTFHYRHNKQVVVIGKVHVFKDRRHLKLVGCHLIMTRTHGYARLKGFILQFAHECEYTRRNSAKVMVFQLLALGAVVSHQRTTCQHQIRTCIVQCLVHQKILLFPTKIGMHVLNLFVKVRTNFARRMTESGGRADKRCLVVQGFASICDEHGRYAKRVTDKKNGGTRVPGGVTAGFKRITYAAARERRCVRLLLVERIAAELLQ